MIFAYLFFIYNSINQSLSDQDPTLVNNLVQLDQYYNNWANNNNIDPLIIKIQSNENILPQNEIVSYNVNLKVGNLEDAKNLLYFASTAYCKKEKLISWNCKNCLNKRISDSELYKTLVDNKFSTFGFISINKRLEKIVISYRGSSNIKNWLLNFHVIQKRLFKSDSKIKVHSGFYESSYSLFNQTKFHLINIIKRYPNYKVSFTGHSLGGVMAVLNALLILDSKIINENQLEVFTYGQPRIGNKDFAAYLNKKKINLTRVTTYNDIVPSFPFNHWGYFHHHNEFFIKNMTSINCSTKYYEDKNCHLSSKIIRSVDAHFKFWDLTIDSKC